MSVADKLTQLRTDITNAYTAINSKGGTIPEHKNTSSLANAIESISAGGDQPQLYAPTITTKSDYLIIAPSESNGEFNTNATYYIYSNGELIHTTTETSVLLYDIITTAGNYTLKVIQGQTNFKDSDASNEAEWLWIGGLRLTNTATSTVSSSIKIQIQGTLDNPIKVSFMKSGDGNWVDWFEGTSGSSTTITISNGEYVELWNDNETWSKDSSNYAQIVLDKLNGVFKVSGAINSLLNGTSVTGKPYCFCKLFYEDVLLKDASELTFPTTDLTGANNCYENMFSDCTSLTTAPSLPATTLASYCYGSMFNGCTSLTTAPELPATTLAEYCYRAMFYGCTSLTTPPELPATTLASYCYQYMFYGCTSLTTPPELPATTLASYCYQYMFYGCTALVTAPTIKATLSTAEYCYANMFEYCTSLTKPASISANSLTNKNWYQMYYGCSKLKIANSQVTKSWELVGVIPPNLGTDGVTGMFKGCDIDSSTSWADTGTPDARDYIYYLPQ